MVLNIINGNLGSKKMICKFCSEELQRKSWCNLCQKPQIDASQVVWTDRTCRKCYNTGSIVLHEMSPYCFDCRLLIVSEDKLMTKDNEEDVMLRLEVRWLQAWLLIDDVTSNSALVSWFPPEFVNSSEIEVENYYIYTTDSAVGEYVDGNCFQILLSNLNHGTKYELRVSAFVDQKLVKKTLKRSFSTMRL
jgi:hypothetical protein